jgi:hypothetical protein
LAGRLFAMNANSMVGETEQLTPVPPVMDVFPATISALRKISTQNVDILLQAYNLPANGLGLPAKRKLLADYIGCGVRLR